MQQAPRRNISTLLNPPFECSCGRYERSRPVCFERAVAAGDGPTFVTVGDGGNREQLYDKWPYHRAAPWSAFRNGTRSVKSTAAKQARARAWGPPR